MGLKLEFQFSLWNSYRPKLIIKSCPSTVARTSTSIINLRAFYLPAIHRRGFAFLQGVLCTRSIQLINDSKIMSQPFESNMRFLVICCIMPRRIPPRHVSLNRTHLGRKPRHFFIWYLTPSGAKKTQTNHDRGLLAGYLSSNE